MIVIIGMVLVLGFIGWYLTFFFSTPIEPKVVKIGLSDVDEGGDPYYLREQYGLTSGQAADVIKHPEKYRWVDYYCELNNTSGTVDIIDVKPEPIFSNKTEKRALYFSKDFLRYQITPGQKYRGVIEVLVKMEEEDTPEKLIEMAKEDRFIISGRKYLFLSDVPTSAPLTQFPMGSFSLEAKYEGK